MSKSCTCKTGYQEGGPVETSGGTASPFTMSGGNVGTADQYMSTGALPHYPVPNAVLMSMSLDKRAGDPSTYNADQTARATRPKQAPIVPPSARFKKGGLVKKTGYQEGGEVDDDDEESTDDEEERQREKEPAEEERASEEPEVEVAAPGGGGGEEEGSAPERASEAAAEEEEDGADREIGGGTATEAGGGGGGLADQGEEAATPAPVQLAAAQAPQRGGEVAAEGGRQQALLDTRATGYQPGQAQATSDPSTENLRKVLEYTRGVFGLGGGQRQPLPEGQTEGPAPTATAAGSGRLPMPSSQISEVPAAPAPTIAQTGYGTQSTPPQDRIGGQQIPTGYGGPGQARPSQAQAPPPAAAPPDAQQGLAAYMEGQRSFSPDEMTRLLDHGVGLDHKGDMGTALHKTFNDLVSAGNVDAASRMLQALRPSYDSLRAVMMAAVGQGEWDKAMQLAEKLNDLLPNGRSLDMSRTSDGNFTAIVHPADRGGHVSSFSLTPQQFAQYANGPASLMDVQGTKGLENTLAALTGTPGAQGTRGGFAPTPYPGTEGRLAGGTPGAQAEAARQVGQGEDPTAAARARLQARQGPAAPTAAGGLSQDWWDAARAGAAGRQGQPAQPSAAPTRPAPAAPNQTAQLPQPGRTLGGLDYTQIPPGSSAVQTPSGRFPAPAPAQPPARAPAPQAPGRQQQLTPVTVNGRTYMVPRAGTPDQYPAARPPAAQPPGQQGTPGAQQAPRTPPAPITQDQSGQPLYPHTVTYLDRNGNPTGRHSIRLSPTPTSPDDPQYIPQPTDPNHRNSSDPTAGPGHYNQNGLWEGFSGVPGVEHPMSYERTMARNIAIARMFPDEYGPMLTGGGGSQHSSIARSGGSQGTSVGGTRLQQMGVNPATYRDKMLRDEMAQFNARQHDYAVQTGETARTSIKDTGETARELERRQAIADGDILTYYGRNPPKDDAGKAALAAAMERQSRRGQNAAGFNPNRLLMGEPPSGPVHQIVPRPGAPDLSIYRGARPPEQHYELPPDYTWYSHPSDAPENTRWEALPRAKPGNTYNFDTRTGRPIEVPKPSTPPAPPPPPPPPPPKSWWQQHLWQ